MFKVTTDQRRIYFGLRLKRAQYQHGREKLRLEEKRTFFFNKKARLVNAYEE